MLVHDVVVGVNDDRRHRRRVQDGVGEGDVIHDRRHGHLSVQRNVAEKRRRVVTLVVERLLVVVAGAVVVDVIVVVDVSRRVVDVDVVGHWRVGQKIHLRIWK